MNRLQQLIKEAIAEVENYDSWITLYYILKSIENNVEKLCKESEINYEVTVDSLILFTIYIHGGRIDKTRLFALSFILYDYMSKNYKVQDPIFYIRWNKRYFIYSPRIDSHLNALSKKGLIIKKDLYYLSDLGRAEAESLFKYIKEKDRKEIASIIEIFKSFKRISEIKTYIRKYLTGS
ncbi:MAG: hypothetical protein RRA45_05450 [Saccharolobus sp.]|jgi:hypothetical protein|uniref:hypothetical protein n=1 Tax=Saccharolobus sp. TaxID=2100761 RepID=UPI0028CC7426|nr:hypothetical protein [Saccharolobus sp.]MDT7861638.1 hypothetical protein [Saccharolobus sp.]